METIHVRLDGTDEVVRARRVETQQDYMHGRSWTKVTFPLILAYAMTVHRSQGATLAGPTIMHVRDAFAPGLLYVMLSRVSCRGG